MTKRVRSESCRASARQIWCGSRVSAGRCRGRFRWSRRTRTASRPACRRRICRSSRLAGGPVKLSARAGLMWPPVSLEHSGPPGRHRHDHALGDQQLDRRGGEGGRARRRALDHARRRHHTATAALFGFNDTAGTLLAFRGWALHDVKARRFSRSRCRRSTSSWNMGSRASPSRSRKWTAASTAVRDITPGSPGSCRAGSLEAFYYDNRGDPEAVNAELAMGLAHALPQCRARVDLGTATQLLAQAMSGTTLMGDRGRRDIWVDTRFRAAFALAHAAAGQGRGVRAGRACSRRAQRQRSDCGRRRGGLVGDARRPLAAGRHASVILEGLHVVERARGAARARGCRRARSRRRFRRRCACA